MFSASSAVTVKLKDVPESAVAGAVTEKCVAVPALTVIGFEIPVIVEVTVSVAVIVWFPAVFSVAGKVPTPLVNVVLGGNTAEGSVLENVTVPL